MKTTFKCGGSHVDKRIRSIYVYYGKVQLGSIEISKDTFNQDEIILWDNIFGGYIHEYSGEIRIYPNFISAYKELIYSWSTITTQLNTVKDTLFHELWEQCYEKGELNNGN
jgi:hypothetical protein